MIGVFWRMADPEDINLEINGADSIQIQNDSLYIHTSCGVLTETPPMS